MFFAVLTVLVFGFTRLYHLDLIPIFADEAIYLRWAQLMAYDWHQLFVPLTDGKTPLFMWLLAPLLRLNFDPLLTGRALAAAAGLGTVAGTYFLAKKLFEVKTARWVLVLTILCPFLLFYDRMSLTDSLLTDLVVWAVYFSTGVGLGLTAAAAWLVKPSALSYLLLAPFFRLKAWRQHLIAGAITVSVYNLLRFSDSFSMIKQRSLDYLQVPSWQHWFSTIQVFSGWLISYLGWPLIFVLALSIIIAAKFREKKIVMLGGLVLLPLIVLAAIGKVVYPRYLLPLVPFILIIVGWGLTRLPKLWLNLVAAVILAGWIKFDYKLLTNPVAAPLPPAETEQYFETWSSGYGLREIRNYLNQLPADQAVVVATEGSFGTLPNGLEIYYSGRPQIKILGIGFPSGGMSQGMEQVLSSGKRLFLVANRNRYTLPGADRLRLIGEYFRPGGESLMFYEVF
jgi:4-amino-4-deoxy-L-arabinose transferase-like glycosyltransferase